jgi:hypothetical protein
LAVQESRRPYRWRETPPRPARREAPTLRLVELRPKVEPRVVAPRLETRRRAAAAARVAIVAAAFTVWSLSSLRDHVDHR